MKTKIPGILAIWCALFVASALIPANAFADVEVFAEVTYRETDCDVYIYANTEYVTSTELRSAGVKLTYDDAEVTYAGAELNYGEHAPGWVLGGETSSSWFLGSEDCPNCLSTDSGEVIMILGKLDPSIPSEGVAPNSRILLGKVMFNRVGSAMPFSPTLGLTYGKRGDPDPLEPGKYKFKNFVDADTGTPMDDDTVAFGTITVKERGDANADDAVNVQDMSATKYYMINGGDWHCWMDCNGDEVINVQDMSCVKYNMTH